MTQRMFLIPLPPVAKEGYICRKQGPCRYNPSKPKDCEMAKACIYAELLPRRRVYDTV